MIKVTAKFVLKPGAFDEAYQLAEELIAITRQETGCVQYDLAQSVNDENILFIFEAWENQAVLDVHSASAHFARLVPQLAALCTEPPCVENFKQII